MAPALIPANQPPRTKKVGDFKIYLDPRVSANQLAQFIVSDHNKGEGIVRDAKRVSTIRVASYQPARAAVSRCYDGSGISAQALLAEATRMESTNFPEAFEELCNKLSAPALRKLSEQVESIDCQGNQILRPSRGNFNHLLIENVRVSIQPEIVFSMQRGTQTKYGGVIVNFSKTDTTSLAHKQGKYSAGDYAAFLVFQMLALHFAREGGPRNASCFAVDAYRDTAYPCPPSLVTMLKNVQAACRNIARQWNDVRIDELEET